MSNLFRMLVFLCFMAMTFIIFSVGCTPEEEKDAVNSTALTSELPETTSQKTETPPVETEKSPEKPLPPVEPAETEPASTSPETENDDAASAENAPPAEFAIASDLWEKKTKGSPIFTHEKHVDVHKVDCNKCHHIYENEKNIWKDSMPVSKCGECHDEPTIKNEKKLSPEDQKKNLKLAFHNNCRACHKALKKENPETKAPVTCKQCHPKK
jgi:hypothetical protein